MAAVEFITQRKTGAATMANPKPVTACTRAPAKVAAASTSSEVASIGMAAGRLSRGRRKRSRRQQR